MKTQNQANTAAFLSALIGAYSTLLKTPPYAAAAINNTPGTLADKVLRALLRGDGDNTGQGVKQACKACGIATTYKAIDAFLYAPAVWPTEAQLMKESAALEAARGNPTA